MCRRSHVFLVTAFLMAVCLLLGRALWAQTHSSSQATNEAELIESFRFFEESNTHFLKLPGGPISGQMRLQLSQARYGYIDFGASNAQEPQIHTVIPTMELSLLLPFTTLLRGSWSSSLENNYEMQTLHTRHFFSADLTLEEWTYYMEAGYDWNLNRSDPVTGDDNAYHVRIPSYQDFNSRLGVQWSQPSRFRFLWEANAFLELVEAVPTESYYENALQGSTRLFYEMTIGDTHRFFVQETLSGYWFEGAGLFLDDLEVESVRQSFEVGYEKTFLLGGQWDLVLYSEVLYSYRYDTQRYITYGLQGSVDYSIGFDMKVSHQWKAQRYQTSLPFLSAAHDEEDSLYGLKDVEVTWTFLPKFYASLTLGAETERYDHDDHRDNNHLLLEGALPLGYEGKTFQAEGRFVVAKEVYYTFPYGVMVNTYDDVLGITNFADPLPPEYEDMGGAFQIGLNLKNWQAEWNTEGTYRWYQWIDTPNEPRGQQYANEYIIYSTFYNSVFLGEKLSLQVIVTHTLRYSEDGYNTGADLEGEASFLYAF